MFRCLYDGCMLIKTPMSFQVALLKDCFFIRRFVKKKKKKIKIADDLISQLKIKGDKKSLAKVETNTA